MRSSLQGGCSFRSTLIYTRNWAKVGGGCSFVNGPFFARLQYVYRQKTHFSYILLGYCVQLGRFCPQEQHRVTQQLRKLHQSNTGVPQKQFQQVCLLDEMMYKCFTCKILCDHLHKKCLLMTCYYQFLCIKKVMPYIVKQ